MKVAFNTISKFYNAFIYGKKCLLSGCCNSLIAFKFEDNLCKVLCLNKGCLAPLLDLVMLKSDLKNKLITTHEKVKSSEITKGVLSGLYKYKSFVSLGNKSVK